MVRLGAVTTGLPLAVHTPRRAGIEQFCSLCLPRRASAFYYRLSAPEDGAACWF
jgi:hypothetical protein